MRGELLASLGRVAKPSIGVLFGTTILAFLADSTHATLLLPPLVASATLAFAARGNPFGRPRSIVGGYSVSVVSGLAMLTVFGYGSPVRVAAVAVAVAAMLLVGALHPPAAALPLLVLPGGPGVLLVLGTVLTGALVLVSLAALANGLFPEREDLSEAEGVPGTHNEGATVTPNGPQAGRGRGVA